MGKVTDLTGEQIVTPGGQAWYVAEAADPVNRVRYWKVEHVPCGTTRVGSHDQLMKLRSGTKNAPELPCLVCQPESSAAITQRVLDGNAENAADLAEAGSPLDQAWPGADPYEPKVVYQGKAVALDSSVEEPVWQIPALADCPVADNEELSGHLVDSAAATIVWHGKAEACEEAQEYMAVIRTKVTQPSKNYQGRSPGMSMLGGCERKLAWTLAEGKESSMSWRAFVGTCTHEWGLGPAFQEDNARQVREALERQAGVVQPGRWLIGARVAAGEPPARGVLDLYDRWRYEIVDWKVAGVTKLDQVRRGHVSDQYEVQLDLYGLGMALQGYRVETVALHVFPFGGRNAEVDDATFYRRTWNPDNALAALARRDRLNAMLTVADTQTVLEAASIQEDACDYCPVLRAGLCEGVNVKTDKGLAQIGWNPAPLPQAPPGT